MNSLIILMHTNTINPSELNALCIMELKNGNINGIRPNIHLIAENEKKFKFNLYRILCSIKSQVNLNKPAKLRLNTKIGPFQVKIKHNRVLLFH